MKKKIVVKTLPAMKTNFRSRDTQVFQRNQLPFVRIFSQLWIQTLYLVLY